MTREGGDSKRQLQVLIFSWLLVASIVAASGIVVGANGIGVGASSNIVGGADPGATTAESPSPFEPRFDFACEQVAVTARGYDSVTLVFEGDDRQTFRWSFRGRNVFFGTDENVGAVVAEVVVRRDGERVTRRNPNFEACTGRNATTATAATVATTTAARTTATTATPTNTPTSTTTATTAPTVTTTTTATPDLPTIEIRTTATAATATTATAATATTVTTATVLTATPTAETTVRDVTATTGINESTTEGPVTTGTTIAATTIPTPTVTPQPIAGYPECSDEEFGLTNALNLTYEDEAFTSEDATEIGENRFRFTVEDESYELELVEVERNEQGQPVSVTFDATLSVDGVIVRSGPGANVYEFSEGVSRRADLRAPTDENTGQSFVIEEIAFCYDPETPNGAEDSSGLLDNLGHGPSLGLGLDLLVGRGATAAVGLAAAGLLVVRRRRNS